MLPLYRGLTRVEKSRQTGQGLLAINLPRIFTYDPCDS